MNMQECVVCGEKAVFQLGAFSFEEYYIEGDGIVFTYQCKNCDTFIECYAPFKREDDDE